MCPPCLSFYIPYFNTGYLPPRLSAGETNKYTGNSLWWNSYRLVLAAEANYEKYHEKVRMAGDVLEDDFHREAELAYQKACELHGRGAAREAADLLNTFTDKCVDKVAAEIDKLTAEIEADLERNPGQVYRTEYVKTIKKLVEMP
jgi:dipeptidase